MLLNYLKKKKFKSVFQKMISPCHSQGRSNGKPSRTAARRAKLEEGINASLG